MRTNHWLSIVVPGLGFGLALLLNEAWSLAPSSTTPGILYVSADDPACGGRSPCFATIQAAVDAAADGDEVRVATGTYTGSAPATVEGNTYTQVVLITKSLTLQGGYTNSNWETPDPAMNRTVIDAGGKGRGISIVGNGTQTVTVAGFTITNGDYTGLGNPPGTNQVCVRTGSDCGGGLFARHVTLNLRDCVITGNVASRAQAFSDGGGAYLWSLNSGSRVENVTFSHNRAETFDGAGGGLGIVFGRGLTIVNCRFEQNRSSRGGGLYIFQPAGPVVIENTAFTRNTASGEGGALEARLTFPETALRLNRVTMRKNAARSQAAAMSLLKQGTGVTTVKMTNVVLAYNSLTNPGSYSAVFDAAVTSGELSLQLAHLTWADQPELAGLRLKSSGGPVTATLVNTVIHSTASAFVGSEFEGEVRIHHTRTLLNLVRLLHVTQSGSPVFEAIEPLEGGLLLDDTQHLRAGSAGIDAGVNSGVSDDMDGDPRPSGAGYDIGADEFLPGTSSPSSTRTPTIPSRPTAIRTTSATSTPTLTPNVVVERTLWDIAALRGSARVRRCSPQRQAILPYREMIGIADTNPMGAIQSEKVWSFRKAGNVAA